MAVIMVFVAGEITKRCVLTHINLVWTLPPWTRGKEESRAGRVRSCGSMLADSWMIFVHFVILFVCFVQSWYMKDNVKVENGQLEIQAREEVGESLGRVQQECWDYCGYLCSQKGLQGDVLHGCVHDCGAHRCPKARFTSGRIRTFGKFSISPSDQFKTIRVEAKVKLSSGNGIWPAFWMLPEEGARPDCSGCGIYGDWPASGEIDIMETFGDMKGVNGTIHFGGQGAHAYHTMGTPLNPGYHVYGIEWEDDTMRWYLDGVEYGRAYRKKDGAPGWFTPSSPTGPFDVNFHILLNLAVGGTYTGNTDVEKLSESLRAGSNSMLVDFVRVYGK